MTVCAGDYLLSVKFNDQHIPDSPFKVCVLPAGGDSQRLQVHDLQQLGIQVSLYVSLCLYVCLIVSLYARAPYC